MTRRDMLKLLVGTGFAAPFVGPLALSSEFSAQEYNGPLLLFIHAYGGWDATQFCDPKGDLKRGFGREDIETIGGVRFAPSVWIDERSGASFDYARDFFSTLHRRMVIVNGINMQTNSHRDGEVNALSGRFSSGYPTLSASLSAANAPSSLMSYVVAGQFKSTGGLLPYTNISDPAVLEAIAYPNRSRSIKSELVPSKVNSLVSSKRRSRIQRRIEDGLMLPRRRKMLSSFLSADAGKASIARLQEVIPSEGFADLDDRGYKNSLVKKADGILHSMAAGLVTAADLQLLDDHFDSHANHVNNQARALANLAYGIQRLWARVDEIDANNGSNLSGRLTIVVHSEFGRTPHLNSDSGTDHWPTTSAIVMRKDFEATGVGSRTVGYSTNDGRYLPGRINPVTLEPDPSGGVELKSAHLHKALRKLLGISDSPVLSNFGFPEIEDVNIFTPGLATPQL